MIVPCSDATSGMLWSWKPHRRTWRQIARQLGLPGRDKADVVDPRTIAVSRMRIRVHLVLARVAVDERDTRAGRDGQSRGGSRRTAVMVIVVPPVPPPPPPPPPPPSDGAVGLLAAAGQWRCCQDEYCETPDVMNASRLPNDDSPVQVGVVLLHVVVKPADACDRERSGLLGLPRLNEPDV